MSVNFHEYIQRISEEQDIFSKARLLEFLTKGKRYKVKDVAEHLGLSSSYICNLLRILKLPELIRDGYYTQLVSPTHLFVLSRLKTQDDMIMVYEEILSQSMSTTQLEARVREVLYGLKTEGKHLDAEVIKDVEDMFLDLNKSMNVNIIQTRVKAKITLEIPGSLKETSLALKKLSRRLKVRKGSE